MTRSETSADKSTGRREMAKVVSSSLIGTTIEWYDFFLFGSASALVFNRLFFPTFEPLVGTLLALMTYAVGFFARPVGGIVFGHFGDIVGRKKILVVSLLVMGVATIVIGLLPSYATVGVLAPILLVLCRLTQGFAVGGEWGGAVLMVSERGKPHRRGFWSSWPQSGVPAGQVLSSGVLAVFAATMPDATFEAWGWRVPFLLSAVLVVVGLWIRISLEESPIFRQAQRSAESVAKRSVPALQVLRHYRRETLIVLGARLCENMSGYVFTVFVLTYVTQHVGLSRGVALNAVVIASIVHVGVVPLWGALSDRLGRRPLSIFGAAGVGAWSFAAFPLIDTGSPLAITLAVTIGLVCHGAMYAPQAAFFSELFGTSVRYSGMSIGHQLASIFGASLAPAISVLLLDRFGSSVPVSMYVALAAIISMTAVILADETARRDLSFERGGPLMPSPATGTTGPVNHLRA